MGVSILKERFAMGPHLLISAAVVPGVLALAVFSSMGSGEGATAPMVANSDRIVMAKAGTRRKQKDFPVCGWIGVRVSPMTKPFAVSLGMTELYGAILDRPQPGSPAALAKIEAGDVLTEINGEPLRGWRDFSPIISAMAPGTSVYLNTYRDGQLIMVTVTLGSSRCPRRS